MSSDLWDLVVLLVFTLVAIHGAYELFQAYSTGHIWANFRSRGEPNNYRLISYTSHPFNFVGMLILDAILVFFGSITGAVFFRKLQAMLTNGQSDGPSSPI